MIHRASSYNQSHRNLRVLSRLGNNLEDNLPWEPGLRMLRDDHYCNAWRQPYLGPSSLSLRVLVFRAAPAVFALVLALLFPLLLFLSMHLSLDASFRSPPVGVFLADQLPTLLTLHYFSAEAKTGALLPLPLRYCRLSCQALASKMVLL